MSTDYPGGLQSIPTIGGAERTYFGGVPATAVGTNTNGNIFFVNPVGGSDGNSGLSPQSPKLTIQSAVDAAVTGAVIYVAPGSYDETVSVDKSLTMVGVGGRGSVAIEPQTAGAEGMQVTAGTDDVTLINIGVAGESTATYALNLNAAARFRAYECKFELGSGTGAAVLLDGTATDQCADILFRDCEFAWAGKGMTFDNSAYGFPTQIFVDACRFHNIATFAMGEETGGAAVNLEVTNCVFDADETGTKPADYLSFASASSSGIFSGNRFAIATNAIGDLKIGANMFWSANATEAGWSTARPV